MAKQSPFDPDAVDPEAYSKDPYQHGDSDFGTPSEGVGNNTYHDSTSGIDMDNVSMENTQATRETTAETTADASVEKSGGTTQDWDVDPNQVKPEGRMMSDEAGKRLKEISDNPSDEALFKRADATYLEADDDPNKGYDPHNRGYDNKPGK